MILPYAPGVDAVPAALTTYVGFGVQDSREETMCWAVPRAGTLLTLQVNVSSNTLNAGGATFTIRRSPACNGDFVDTPLTITIGVETGCFSVASAITIDPGDRVSLQVQTTGTQGAVYFSAGLEVS